MSGCLSGSPCDDILTLIGEQVMVQRARQNFSQVLKHIEEGDESDADLLNMVFLGNPPAGMPLVLVEHLHHDLGGDYVRVVEADLFPFWNEWDGYECMEWDEETGKTGDYKEESVFYRWGNKWGGNMWTEP